MKPKKKDENRCVLCGEADHSLMSDHLRCCYWYSGSRKFDGACFVPRLFEGELRRLSSGSNVICGNRRACRERQRKHITKQD
jgi:hypothetical protein